MAENPTDIQGLSALIAAGTASEADTGIALRTLQTALSCRLVNNLQQITDSYSRLSNLLDTCVNKFSTQVNEMIEADSISYDNLFDIIDKIQSKQVAFLELQRKIIQSPNKLFSDDILSPEEKKLLTLLKSFNSPDEKKVFLKAVESALKDKSNNDFS